ncbi:MAG: protein kinase [Planctomycetes bacterium]|nr:protein kinase [Planctomycetota bacterium]
MPDDTESYFVSLAVQRGMATREAAQECLELARTPRSQGRSVVHLLVERARIPTDKARVLHQEAVAMASQARGRGADLQRWVSESTTGSGVAPAPPTPAASPAVGPRPGSSSGFPTPVASPAAGPRPGSSSGFPMPGQAVGPTGTVASTRAPGSSWPPYGAGPEPTPSASQGTLLSRVRTFTPGETFGRYRLESELGRGGMGVVWRARQLDLDRPVAVKMLLAGATGDERKRRRFLAEARAVARLVHPNIVAIHDVGEHEGVLYFTMDLVEGPSLADAIKPKPLSLERALEVARGIADGLACAHAQKLVHRDLKPANILLDPRGTPRITDFGIAKDLEAVESHTVTGEVLGTPTYMPPEQADGRTHLVDGRADIYALGAILYRMIAGRPPFEGVTPYDVITKVLSAEPTPLRKLDRSVPEKVDAMVLRCLAKDREQRYPTIEALGQDIAAALEAAQRRRTPARPAAGGGRGPLLGAAVAVAVLGVGIGAAGWWYARQQAEELRIQRQREEEAERRAAEEKRLREAAERREQALERARLALAAQADRPREALALAREAVDLGPDVGEALVALGTLTLGVDGDARAALEPLDRALALEPDNLLARLTRARCLLQLDRPQTDVEAEINHIDRLGPAGRSAAAELRCEVALRKGELAVALVHLDEATHHDDKNARLRLRHAELLLRARRFSAADEEATAALRLDRTAAALVVRASARKELGKAADALADAEEALKLEPQHAQARTLAEALRPKRQPTQPTTTPGGQGDHSGHASVHQALKALREALARRDGREAGRQLQLALELRDVPCAPALTERAQVLMEVERFQDAAQDLERLLRLQGETVTFHLLRADLMQRTKRLDEAERSYARAIELDPRDYRPHEARAQLHEDRKEVERAGADWDQVVAKAPPDRRGWLVHERAHYFHRIGQLDRALADMDEALGLEKTSGHLWLVRGEIRAEMGLRVEAISDLKEALRVGLRGNEEQRARKKLEQLEQ